MPKQLGVTLLELILVLAVASSLMVLGLRVYYTYSNNVAIQQIGQQVGFIFDAMRLYYYANCNPNYSSATLAQVSTNPVIVLSGSSTALVPFLTEKFQKVNGMVNSTDSNTYYGYVAQFNLHTANRTPPSTTTTAPSTATANNYNTTYYGTGPVGTVVTWTSQVAVEPLNPIVVLGLVSSLGAECGSNFASSAAGVYNCANPPGGTPAVPDQAWYNCTYGSDCAHPTCSASGMFPITTGCVNECWGATRCTSVQNSSQGYITGTPAIPPPAPTYVEFEQTPSYGGRQTVNTTFMPMLRYYKYEQDNAQYQGFQRSGQSVQSNGSYSTNYYYCGS